MGFAPLPFTSLVNPRAREFFDRANGYLADVYTMLHVRPRAGSKAGQCNMTSVLVLVAVVDALAAYVYPGRGQADQEKRFKQLLRDKLPWTLRDLSAGQAATILYLELRNLLVHELGMDRPSRARPPGTAEPVCGRWGRIPVRSRRMDRLDARFAWPQDWPMMETRPSPVDPQRRVKICCVAFYWAVKRMTEELLEEVRIGKLKVA
jgi:hypothetical protein